MAPRRPAQDWHDVPGAQELMDKALPLAAAAKETRDCGPIAEVVLQTTLLFTTPKGLPDLRRSGGLARAWMADLLDAIGFAPPRLAPMDERKKVARERESLAQAIREALSPVRVAFVRQLDGHPEERERLFPGFSSSVEIFEYYKIIPKAQREIRIARYNHRISLQKLGSLLSGDEPPIAPADGEEAVHAVHRLATALTPDLFDGVDVETRSQLRQELSETRAALLALEDALS
ncbi:hypothetical protein [Kitasatospora sp. MBT66]|uniref:hypothetical protein n=1 Tax=Kitasatospora sp. MBT66 TaxID=1444769 RepID=UPI0005B89C5A|nr:hypothetical protein [Kitasatospora sp. MBT66]